MKNEDDNENEDCHTDGKLKLLPMLMPKKHSLSLSFSLKKLERICVNLLTKIFFFIFHEIVDGLRKIVYLCSTYFMSKTITKTKSFNLSFLIFNSLVPG